MKNLCQSEEPSPFFIGKFIWKGTNYASGKDLRKIFRQFIPKN